MKYRLLPKQTVPTPLDPPTRFSIAFTGCRSLVGGEGSMYGVHEEGAHGFLPDFAKRETGFSPVHD
jgi:hypothetical protein